jgi:hypothetical protein
MMVVLATIVLAALATIALTVVLKDWTPRVRFPSLFVKQAPPAQLVSSDHEIFDILLLDLIGNKDFTPATGGRGVKKSQIVFDGTTVGGIGYAWAEACCGDDVRKKIPRDVRYDVLKRNPDGKRYSLALYHPSNPNILLVDLRPTDLDFLEFCRQYPNARGYVEAYLPGYSPNGQEAVVLFRCGPTEHGAQGAYFLIKTSGRWEIAWRDIYYFS